jgi:hypothetical protein
VSSRTEEDEMPRGIDWSIIELKNLNVNYPVLGINHVFSLLSHYMLISNSIRNMDQLSKSCSTDFCFLLLIW